MHFRFMVYYFNNISHSLVFVAFFFSERVIKYEAQRFIMSKIHFSGESSTENTFQ